MQFLGLQETERLRCYGMTVSGGNIAQSFILRASNDGELDRAGGQEILYMRWLGL
jgi:hypothetical protein